MHLVSTASQTTGFPHTRFVKGPHARGPASLLRVLTVSCARYSDLGYIKQPLYGCLTCLNNGAVCAACSISCHGEHQLVELFNRRDFRCDCGTERLGAGSCCSLSKRDDVKANEGNKVRFALPLSGRRRALDENASMR